MREIFLPAVHELQAKQVKGATFSGQQVLSFWAGFQLEEERGIGRVIRADLKNTSFANITWQAR
ncbi:MAG: hypothetical protein LC674_06470 [Actinobacteria bacterium]|nr:hypothetical protein [Actinomycetota bacterium]